MENGCDSTSHVQNLNENFTSFAPGSSHLVVVEEVAKGAVVVSLKTADCLYRGVLLDNTNKLAPITLPKSIADQKETATLVELDYSQLDDIGSATQLRHTYQSDLTGTAVTPSKSITAGLHRAPRSLRIRSSLFKPKLLLCSMCKSHYKYQEEDEIPLISQTNPPSLKISYQGSEGQKTIEISSKRLKEKKNRKRKRHEDKMMQENSGDMPEVQIDPYDFSEALHSPKKVIQEEIGDNKQIATPSNTSKSIGSAGSLASRSKRSQQKTKRSGRKSVESSEESEAEDAEDEPELKQLTEATMPDGRKFLLGDVIWGKIVGFPWWPGRISSITESAPDQHEAEIDWYASNTKSHLPCGQLNLFLDDFERRLIKKKQSKSYKQAIEDAKSDAIINAQLREVQDAEEGESDPEKPPSPVDKSPSSSEMSRSSVEKSPSPVGHSHSTADLTAASNIRATENIQAPPSSEESVIGQTRLTDIFVRDASPTKEQISPRPFLSQPVPPTPNEPHPPSPNEPLSPSPNEPILKPELIPIDEPDVKPSVDPSVKRKSKVRSKRAASGEKLSDEALLKKIGLLPGEKKPRLAHSFSPSPPPPHTEDLLEDPDL